MKSIIGIGPVITQAEVKSILKSKLESNAPGKLIAAPSKATLEGATSVTISSKDKAFPFGSSTKTAYLIPGNEILEHVSANGGVAQWVSDSWYDLGKGPYFE